MPSVVDSDLPTRAMSLEEAVCFAEGLDDPLGDDINATAFMLLSLARNNEFLSRFLVEGLSDPGTFQTSNTNLNRSFVLATGKFGVLRTVLWFPSVAGEQALENRINVYDPLAHDHRFSFVTTNLFGPGYLSENWITDPEETCSLEIGDAVDFDYLGLSRLRSDEVLHYKEHVDVHRQAAPESLSISLNLVIPASGFAIRRQIYFDPTTSTIAHVFEGDADDVTTLCRVARAGFADKLHGPLEKLAAAHPLETVQRAALGLAQNAADEPTS